MDIETLTGKRLAIQEHDWHSRPSHPRRPVAANRRAGQEWQQPKSESKPKPKPKPPRPTPRLRLLSERSVVRSARRVAQPRPKRARRRERPKLQHHVFVASARAPILI